MTPAEFQAIAIAWAAVIIAIIGFVSGPVINLITKIRLQWELAQHKAETDKQLALQQQQVEQNTARLNGQSGKIDTLMLQSPGSVVLPVLEAGGKTEPDTPPCP